MSDAMKFERGYQAGYRAALGAAAAECRRHAEAIDHGGNTYTRYGDAVRLASAVLALRVPAIEDEAARECRFCGCTDEPGIAADPYTTDGTVEVCPRCNNAESYVAALARLETKA